MELKLVLTNNFAMTSRDTELQIIEDLTQILEENDYSFTGTNPNIMFKLDHKILYKISLKFDIKII